MALLRSGSHTCRSPSLFDSTSLMAMSIACGGTVASLGLPLLVRDIRRFYPTDRIVGAAGCMSAPLT